MNMEEDLQQMIAGTPHDTSWVQVAAKFDVDEVVATFSSGSEQFEAIPTQWYDGGADIFDIEILGFLFLRIDYADLGQLLFYYN